MRRLLARRPERARLLIDARHWHTADQASTAGAVCRVASITEAALLALRDAHTVRHALRAAIALIRIADVPARGPSINAAGVALTA